MLLGHAPGVGLGGAGWSKILAWGFAMAPHRLHILDLISFVKRKIKINLNKIH